jgi:hypothetical protein
MHSLASANVNNPQVRSDLAMSVISVTAIFHNYSKNSKGTGQFPCCQRCKERWRSSSENADV